MPDERTLRQKLNDMANQDDSPHEADLARRALERLGPEPGTRACALGPPRRKPTAWDWIMGDSASDAELDDFIRRTMEGL